jgi:hypothetical protein
VRMLSAYGVPEEQIADTIGPRGISGKTLRKYFHRELAAGMMKANATVAQTLYKMATSGDYPAATIFWCKTRMRWSEKGLAPSAAPNEIMEETSDEVEKRITEGLARIAVARSAAGVPEEHEARPAKDGVLVEGLDSAARPTGSRG